MFDNALERIWPVTLQQIEPPYRRTLVLDGCLATSKRHASVDKCPCSLKSMPAGGVGLKIGRFYNGRHHTTVIHAIEKIEQFQEKDETADAAHSAD